MSSAFDDPAPDKPSADGQAQAGVELSAAALRALDTSGHEGLEVMFRFARACARIASCQSGEECRAEGTAAARDLFDADVSWLALVEGDELVLRASSGLRRSDLDRTWRMPVGKGIAGVVAADGQPRIVRDYRNDPRRDNSIKSIVDAEGVRSAVIAPLLDSDAITGVIIIAKYEPDQFSDVQLAVAQDVGVAIGQWLSALESKSHDTASRARAEALLDEHRSGLRLLSTVTDELTADGLDWSRSLDRLASWLDGAITVRNQLGQTLGSAGLREGPTSRFAFPGGFEDEVALYVTTERRLTVAQKDVCRAAAGMLALEFARERSRLQAESRFFTGLFDELVDGGVPDEQQMIARAAIAGTDLSMPRTVLCVSVEPNPTSQRSLPPAVVRGVERYLAAQYKGAATTVRDGRLVMFVPSLDVNTVESRRDLGHETLDTIRAYVDVPSIAIGVGDECRQISDYPRAYRRALIAIASLERASRDGVVLLEDLGLYGVLAQSTTEPALNELVMRTLGPLLESDRDGSSDYIKTLQFYFKHDRHLQLAADDLFVHVNTLRYRLKRVQEMLHIDLRSPDDRFTLELAIHLVGSDGIALSESVSGSRRPRRPSITRPDRPAPSGSSSPIADSHRRIRSA